MFQLFSVCFTAKFIAQLNKLKYLRLQNEAKIYLFKIITEHFNFTNI